MRRLIVVMMVVLCAGCSPWAGAWRTTAGVKAAAEMTDKAIAAAAIAAHKDCLTKHKAGKEKYQPCVEKKKAYKALIQWRAFGRPAVNSALRATITGLTIAENVKGKKFNWLAILKPAACAVVKIVVLWGDLLGEKKEAIKRSVEIIGAITCH